MFRPLTQPETNLQSPQNRASSGLTVKTQVSVPAIEARRYESGQKISVLRALAPAATTSKRGPTVTAASGAHRATTSKQHTASPAHEAARPAAVSTPVLPVAHETARPAAVHTPVIPIARYAVRQTANGSGGGLTGRIVFARGGDLWMADGSGTHLLARLDNARDPAVSPDGKSLVYMRQFEDYSDLWLANLDGSDARSLTHDNVTSANTKDNYWAAQPAWSPDGQHLLFLTDRGKALGPDSLGQYGMGIWRLDLGAAPAIASLVTPELWTGGDADPTWRPSVPGAFAYTRYHYDPAGPSITGQIALSDGTVLTNATDGAFQAAWSPDGRMLAYVERQGDQDLLRVVIFASPAATTPSRPVTVATGMLAHPIWSPDGRTLGYVALQNASFVVQTATLTVAGQTVSMGTPHTVDGTADLDAASTLSWTK
jgi:hypothetical protein